MEWFVAVADGDQEERAVQVFLERASQRIDHPSGRPWLVGNWADDRLVHVAERGVQVAVLGASSATASLLRGCRLPVHLDAIAHQLSGEWHLLAAIDGQSHARGMASGLRRVCHTMIDGVPVAADRADVLAVDAQVDVAALAVNLITRGARQLGDVSPWLGVRRVPPDSAFVTQPGGAWREVRWWTPPVGELTLAEGVPLVRQALQNAVAARLAGSVSADLSGGMDSTSVCFLIEQFRPVRFVTQVTNVPDPDFDDIMWATRAAEQLSSSHLVVEVADIPEIFGDTGSVWVDPEQPDGWTRSRARLRNVAVRMAAAGSEVHFTGTGGDELFRPWVHYLHTLVRTHPLRALRDLSTHRRHTRWKARDIVRAVADRRSYWRTVTDAVAHIGQPESASGVLDMSWASPLHLPPWATEHAAELARAKLLETEREPLGADRAAHVMLESLRASAENVRLSDRLSRRHGIRTTSPFMDDRVVEAVLSVRQSEHGGVTRYKPLLAGAMRGIVPAEILGRRTKGEFSSEVHHGLRRNRVALMRLFEDSELARHGLIDPAGVRDMLVGVHKDNLGVIALESTLACEVWLRDVATRTARVGR